MIKQITKTFRATAHGHTYTKAHTHQPKFTKLTQLTIEIRGEKKQIQNTFKCFESL